MLQYRRIYIFCCLITDGIFRYVQTMPLNASVGHNNILYSVTQSGNTAAHTACLIVFCVHNHRPIFILKVTLRHPQSRLSGESHHPGRSWTTEIVNSTNSACLHTREFGATLIFTPRTRLTNFKMYQTGGQTHTVNVLAECTSNILVNFTKKHNNFEGKYNYL